MNNKELENEFYQKRQRAIYYSKNKHLIYKQQIGYIKNNPWVKIRGSIASRCNNKNNPNYRWYGAKGIKCNITTQEVKMLWVRDKAYFLNRPSIDRINVKGNYEISNCQFIELLENTMKDRPPKKGAVIFYKICFYCGINFKMKGNKVCCSEICYIKWRKVYRADWFQRTYKKCA